MQSTTLKLKRTIYVIILQLLIIPVNNLYSQQFEYAGEQQKLPILYFGLGLGVNEYGVGLNLEVPFTRQLSINGTVGLGGWAWKFGANLNFYPTDVTRRHELSVGFSTASGLDDFETELMVEPDGAQRTVSLDLHRVNTINLFYTYNIKAGRACKAAFSIGYAINTTSNPYDLNSNVILTSLSEQVIRITQPGGLIIGIKFMIGAL